MEHEVIFEQGPEGWSASVPSLPGCTATGRTRAEVGANIVEAIRLHVIDDLIAGRDVSVFAKER